MALLLANRTVKHCILYGQSLSLGADPDGASVITTSASPRHLMFNGGVRCHYDTVGIPNVNSFVTPSQIASLVPLTEQANPNDADYGETLAAGMASQLIGRWLFSATGRSAYPCAYLSRCPTAQLDGCHFGNTYATVLQASLLAASSSCSYMVPFIVFKQGEGDAAAKTSRATWKTEVQTLYSDFKSHLALAAIVDTSTLCLLVDQISLRLDTYTYGEIAVAAIELHRLGIGIVCVGPTYYEEYTATDDVHFVSNGYRNYGERLGHVISSAGRSWNPCYITGASRSGTTITAIVHVPYPPLVKDTTLVAAIANDGFAYSGATITGVTIADTGTVDNTGAIQIEVDAAAGGTLRYAYENCTTNNRIGPVVGPRGNYRDSDPAVTINDGKKLYNWLCIDEWVVA